MQRAGRRRLVLAHPAQLQRRRAEPRELRRERRRRAAGAAHVGRHHRVLEREARGIHRHLDRGRTQQRRPEGELERARGGLLGLLVRRGGRRRPAGREIASAANAAPSAAPSAVSRGDPAPVTAGPARPSAARGSTAAQRLERRFVAREQLFGGRFDLFDDGRRVQAGAERFSDLGDFAGEFAGRLFDLRLRFRLQLGRLFLDLLQFLLDRFEARLGARDRADAERQRLQACRPAFRSRSATCRLPLWPCRTFPIRIPRTRRAAARTVRRRGRGPVG